MKLRYYQDEAVNNTISYIRKGSGKNPLIVLPTGSGKTPVIGKIIRKLLNRGEYNILVLSHVREILLQNLRTIKAMNKGVEIGVYSSMLNKKQIRKVTIGGIQSVYRNSKDFSHFNIVIIDEAHMLPPEDNSMYRKFLSGLKANVIGLTATPFRLGSGYIYGKDKYFDDVVCDYSFKDKFIQLIKDGYLSPLITKKPKEEMDVSDIGLVKGDFNEKQLSEKFDREQVTEKIISEIIHRAKDRKKWLIFAIDINHAEHIAELLIRQGIPTAPVHSKMKEFGFDRGNAIENLRIGKYRCAVSVNILTTGFDDPEIDFICVVRPTTSPVLHVQMLGRGSRISKGKTDCLVADFAGNTERLGPINDIQVKEKGKGKEGGDPITKTCPMCDSIVAPAVRVCPDCGFKFPIEHKLKSTASDYEVIENGGSNWLIVEDVHYSINQKIGMPSSIRVTYKAAGKNITEYVCIEHKGFAKHKADHWVKFRGGKPCDTIDQFMKQAESLAKPRKILVKKQHKYFIIRDSIF